MGFDGCQVQKNKSKVSLRYKKAHNVLYNISRVASGAVRGQSCSLFWWPWAWRC